jgi:hypothetical protein
LCDNNALLLLLGKWQLHNGGKSDKSANEKDYAGSTALDTRNRSSESLARELVKENLVSARAT